MEKKFKYLLGKAIRSNFLCFISPSNSNFYWIKNIHFPLFQHTQYNEWQWQWAMALAGRPKTPIKSIIINWDEWWWALGGSVAIWAGRGQPTVCRMVGAEKSANRKIRKANILLDVGLQGWNGLILKAIKLGINLCIIFRA